MSEYPKKYWFLVSADTPLNVNYIFLAENPANAFEVFSPLASGREIIQLTWRAIHGLTDCIIPEGFNGDDYASGSLLFQHNDSLYSFPIPL